MADLNRIAVPCREGKPRHLSAGNFTPILGKRASRRGYPTSKASRDSSQGSIPAPQRKFFVVRWTASCRKEGLMLRTPIFSNREAGERTQLGISSNPVNTKDRGIG